MPSARELSVARLRGASWSGRGRTGGRLSLHRRPPRQIGATSARLTGAWEPDTVLAEVQRVWPDAVGDAVARRRSRCADAPEC